jgi:hypothetical protein
MSAEQLAVKVGPADRAHEERNAGMLAQRVKKRALCWPTKALSLRFRGLRRKQFGGARRRLWHGVATARRRGARCRHVQQSA